MSGKVGLVTGCAGFIGSHLCDSLVKKGWEVVGVDDLSTGGRGNIAHLLSHKRFRFVRADVIRPGQLKPQWFKGVDCVFHLGGRKMVFSVEHPQEDLLTNIYGTLNLLIQSAESGVGRFILASSSAVYGEPVSVPTSEDAPILPTNPYGVSKFAAEEYCRLWHRKYGLPTIVLRYSNVYGPRQALNVGVVPAFVTRILQDRPITIHGDGSQLRCLTYVQDVVDATLLAASTRNPRALGEAFNAVSNAKISVLKIAQIIAKKLNRELKIEYQPLKKGAIKQMFPDIRKIRRILNFTPRISLEEGLLRTIRYYEKKYAM